MLINSYFIDSLNFQHIMQIIYRYYSCAVPEKLESMHILPLFKN